MRRLRHPTLPLALLFIAQGCTSIIVVGDRDDAATADQPTVSLDLGQTSDRPDAPLTPDVPSTSDVPDVLAVRDAADVPDVTDTFPCRAGHECVFEGAPCRIGRVECVGGADGGFTEVCVDNGLAPDRTPCDEYFGPCRRGATCNHLGQCNGGGNLPLGTICRPSTGPCDPAGVCLGGLSPLCPSSMPYTVGMVCRPSTGVCDPAETCTGTSPDCPADVFLPSSTVCAPSTSGCPARTCTGVSGACPADSGSAEVCNNIDDDCDGRVDEDVTMACYTGPTGTAGVGVCRAGTQSCAAGAWGGCVGQVIPTPEVCDALDNDCNGVINNGITCP